jgi:hypothetical protein
VVAALAINPNTVLRDLLGWMRTAQDAGLDGHSVVAMFTSALNEFRAGRTGAVAARP